MKLNENTGREHKVKEVGKDEFLKEFLNGSSISFGKNPPPEDQMLKSAEAFSGSNKEFVVDDDGKKELKTGGLIKESAE